ncbi:MAG TPA: hypothetical protein VGC41_06635, partial [Kofleriaceae bacterium]
FDAGSRWMVTISKSDNLRLDFGRYDSFEDELEQLVSLSTLPALADARAKRPELDWGPHEDLRLPPNEYSLEIEMTGHTQSVSVAVGEHGLDFSTLLDAAYLSELDAALTKRWGPPIRDKKTNAHQSHLVWPGHAELFYRVGTNDVMMQVGASSQVW